MTVIKKGEGHSSIPEPKEGRIEIHKWGEGALPL